MEFDHSVLPRLMEDKGLRLIDVAETCGLYPSQVHNILEGKTKNPMPPVVSKLAKGLGVHWAIFYGLDFQEKEQAV